MGKILVIRGGAIGDFILTVPAIRLLTEGLPDAELEVMGYKSIISLAEASGYAKRTRSIEYGALASFFAKGADLNEELCAYFAEFSVVVSYLYDPDGILRENLERAGVQTLIECSHRVANDGPPAAEQLAKPLESLALFLEDGFSSRGGSENLSRYRFRSCRCGAPWKRKPLQELGAESMARCSPPTPRGRAGEAISRLHG